MRSRAPLIFTMTCLLAAHITPASAAAPVPTTPTLIAGATSVKAITRKGFALKTDGTVQRIYDNDRVKPVVGATGVDELVEGDTMNYGLRSNGTVIAWGRNDQGQLGNGRSGDGDTAKAVTVKRLTQVRQVAAAGWTGFALRDDGRVWTWGANFDGELGNGTHGYARLTPARVSHLTKVAKLFISGSGYSSTAYALRTDGTIWVWGAGGYGQIGDGKTDRADRPVRLKGLTKVTQIATAYGATYALRTNGTVYAWGDKSHGTSYSQRRRPTQIGGLSDVAAVSAGYGTGSAVTNTGELLTWGWNTFGELGDGTTTRREFPAVVEGIPIVRSAWPTLYGMAAIAQDGSLWFWGNNRGDSGQDSGYAPSSRTPVKLNLSNISQAPAPWAVSTDGTVWRWQFSTL